ncbi:MAG: DNA topoisomerase IV subunit A [Candidatus Nanoarchaeia archaeon]|jgi:DNA topoisomerase-6 subunit A|nr:DNA topoisomerase IV subunit A [Candidatus Nanoarchaeia archaeon]|tara:strand:- start:7345 stop:8433 length:1089 start_codon:yes stop_codon:yes gene_type:complete
MAKKKNNPKEKLQELGKRVSSDIKKNKNPNIDVPIRALSNVSYDKRNKILVMGDKIAKRFFFNVAHAKKFMQTLEIAAISKKLIQEGKHASLRDVFYMAKRTIPSTKVNIVDEQPESDSIIEDLELVTENSRELLNINANKNGSIAGSVVVEDRGDRIDWSKMGSGGWSIPSNVEDIKFLKVNAKYVLYMEKAAVWERLHEDKFWDKQKCIIISSQGQTTRGIRRLLQRLNKDYQLPIYVLTDMDPWGIYIYSVLKFGSISLSHLSEKLALPSAKYLGITVDDIKNYKLDKHLIKFKDKDSSRLSQISKYEWFKDNKEWQRQFKMMKEMNAKAEIQALSSRGISFISEKYLPEKIKKKDFLD